MGTQSLQALSRNCRRNLRHRHTKKHRSQVVQRSSEGASRSIAPLCELLGVSRQTFYKRPFHDPTALDEEAVLVESSIVLYCQHLRRREHLPKAGFRELFLLCKQYFGEKFTIGRDRFCALLRANDLMLRKRRYRPRTTNSNHPYHKYNDLLNTHSCTITAPYSSPAALASSARMSSDFWPIKYHSRKEKVPSRSGFPASMYVVLKTKHVNPNIHVCRY